MRRFAPFALLALLAVFGCGGGTVISDSVSPVGPVNLAAGQSVTFTATVIGDSTNSGVVWQLVGSGTLTGQTPTTVVYTAPSPVTASGSAAVVALPVKNPLYSAAASVNYTPALSFSTVTLPTGTIGTAYSAQLATTGGTAPVTFALTSGTLPAGLTLSPTGAITGTPTAGGNTTLTFSATDSSSTPATVSATFTLPVNALKLAITTTSVPNGVAGKGYSVTLAQTGGIAPYTWTLASGTLPTGLTLSTAGVLSGTPGVAGIFSFAVKVTDTEATPQTATQSYTITVYTVLAITTASLPNGSVKNAYSSTLATSGGTQPFTYSLASGALPAGLTLSAAGVISGTPTTAGASTFTVQVTDASSPVQTATATYTLTIVLSTLAITTTTLPQGTVTAAYSATLQSSGGNPPVTWSLATGSSLPGGLTLSSAGVISGTPTIAGTFTFTVQATDATPATVSQALTITVVALAPLTISTTSLPAGNIGTAYSSTISATGGATPYTFSVASGTLPGRADSVGRGCAFRHAACGRNVHIHSPGEGHGANAGNRKPSVHGDHRDNAWRRRGQCDALWKLCGADQRLRQWHCGRQGLRVCNDRKPYSKRRRGSYRDRRHQRIDRGADIAHRDRHVPAWCGRARPDGADRRDDNERLRHRRLEPYDWRGPICCDYGV